MKGKWLILYPRALDQLAFGKDIKFTAERFQILEKQLLRRLSSLARSNGTHSSRTSLSSSSSSSSSSISSSSSPSSSSSSPSLSSPSSTSISTLDFQHLSASSYAFSHQSSLSPPTSSFSSFSSSPSSSSSLSSLSSSSSSSSPPSSSSRSRSSQVISLLSSPSPFSSSSSEDTLGYSLFHLPSQLDVEFQKKRIPPLTERLLGRVHSRHYLNFLEELNLEGGYISGDTFVPPGFLSTALEVSGATLDAMVTVLEHSTVNEYQGAIIIGAGQHHASRHRGGGFSVINDIAVATEYLLQRSHAERVMIIDTDAHAGDGTMDIFYYSDKVLFVSIHQHPKTIFPHTGYMNQLGAGTGEGFTVNIPMPPMSGDESWLYALSSVVDPLVREFKPDVIIRNGGSDPHWADKLSDLALTSRGLYNVGAYLRSLAVSQGIPYFDLLASGYQPVLTPFLWISQIMGVLGIPFEHSPHSFDFDAPAPAVSPVDIDKLVLKKLFSHLREYWSGF